MVRRILAIYRLSTGFYTQNIFPVTHTLTRTPYGLVEHNYQFDIHAIDPIYSLANPPLLQDYGPAQSSNRFLSRRLAHLYLSISDSS